jgi:transposase
VSAVLTAGGEVWFGDETTLREFPPLRASWAKRGKQREVVISGRNGRRVIHGALQVATGELVRVVRERSRQDDCIALLEALGQVRPGVPKLLIWDNAPPHHPKRVLAAAAAAHVTIAWLPFRSPELNPLEDLWRLLKAVVAANRVYDTLDALADHALRWLDACLPDSLLTRCGLRSSKYDWLPT